MERRLVATQEKGVRFFLIPFGVDGQPGSLPVYYPKKIVRS